MKLKIAHQSLDGLTWELPVLPKGAAMETMGPVQKIGEVFERWAIYDFPDPAIPVPGDVESELRIKIAATTLKSLRSALQVRLLASTTPGLPEAFLFRVLECIDEGKTEYTFALKKSID